MQSLVLLVKMNRSAKPRQLAARSDTLSSFKTSNMAVRMAATSWVGTLPPLGLLLLPEVASLRTLTHSTMAAAA